MTRLVAREISLQPLSQRWDMSIQRKLRVEPHRRQHVRERRVGHLPERVFGHEASPVFYIARVKA